MELTDKKYYPWLLVVIYSLTGVFFPAAVTQYTMVTGSLADALNVESRIILLTDTTRAVCLVTSMFLSSLIYRKIGLRKTMALGLFCQITPQFMVPVIVRLKLLPALFILKGMQGLNAMAFPLYISTITIWIGERYAGLATAIFNGSFVAGSGVGAWIAGKIIPAFGWELSFYAIGGICLVFGIPVLLVTRDKPVGRTKEAPGGLNVYRSIITQPVTWILIAGLVANTWVAQAVTVDMSVYASDMGYEPGQTGNLMLAISFVTVISSILAGSISDYMASRSIRPVRTRSIIMGAGYLLSAAAAAILPRAAYAGYGELLFISCAMMFGASWAGGVFWALPVEVYAPEDNVPGTAFCSGASNIPNPIAPMVVGVMLGTQGYWPEAWLTCSAVSIFSLMASLMLAARKSRREEVLKTAAEPQT